MIGTFLHAWSILASQRFNLIHCTISIPDIDFWQLEGSLPPQGCALHPTSPTDASSSSPSPQTCPIRGQFSLSTFSKRMSCQRKRITMMVPSQDALIKSCTWNRKLSSSNYIYLPTWTLEPENLEEGLQRRVARLP